MRDAARLYGHHSVGGATGTLLTCPLEVVRTRLQVRDVTLALCGKRSYQNGARWPLFIPRC